MREIKHEMQQAKKRVELLMGRSIKLKINKGRNKFITFNGEIETMYPSVFVIKSYEDNVKYTYSYTDVLTKCVRFFPLEVVETEEQEKEDALEKIS